MKLYQSVKNLLKRSGFMRWLVAGSKRCLYAQQRKKEIPRYFRENPNFRALQLGCGGNLLKGWLNADYFGKRKEAIFIDITEAFPFGDDQFDCLMGTLKNRFSMNEVKNLESRKSMKLRTS
jgi:hypothetical protein